MSMGQKVSGGIKTGSNRESNYKALCKENMVYNPDYQKPSRLDMLLDMPPPPKEVQVAHSWNPDDRSLNSAPCSLLICNSGTAVSITSTSKLM
jgi:SPRY domain-containing SOCS box protein 1/4